MDAYLEERHTEATTCQYMADAVRIALLEGSREGLGAALVVQEQLVERIREHQVALDAVNRPEAG